MAVKKPQSAYFLWMNANREKFTAELKGEKGFGAIARMASEKWKVITEAEKKQFDDLAKKEKEAFEEFKKTPEGQKALEEKKEGKQDKKDAKTNRAIKSAVKSVEKDDKLKRPLSGYFMWLNASREGIVAKLEGKHSTGDITKKVADVWTKMTDAEKKPWQDKAKTAKEEHDVFLKSPEGEALLAAYSDATKSAKAEVKGAPAEKEPVKKKQKEDKPDKEDKADKAESPGAKKRPKKEAAVKAEPSPKKAKGKNAKAEAAGIALDDATVAAAEKAGFGPQLRNLAKRDDIIAKGCEGKALLKALQSNEGLVNKAKAILLGGA